MRVFARTLEHALDVTIERPHDADARKHRRAAAQFREQDQCLDPGEPAFWQPGYMCCALF